MPILANTTTFKSHSCGPKWHGQVLWVHLHVHTLTTTLFCFAVVPSGPHMSRPTLCAPNMPRLSTMYFAVTTCGAYVYCNLQLTPLETALDHLVQACNEGQ